MLKRTAPSASLATPGGRTELCRSQNAAPEPSVDSIKKTQEDQKSSGTAHRVDPGQLLARHEHDDRDQLPAQGPEGEEVEHGQAALGLLGALLCAHFLYLGLHIVVGTSQPP